MKNTIEEVKTILAKAMEQAFGVDVKDEIEVDDFAAFIDPDLVFVTCGGEVNGKSLDFNFAKTWKTDYKFTICCGECNDVNSALKELKSYDQSPIGQVLVPECEIEDVGDVLNLTAEFTAKDVDSAVEILTQVLAYLADNEKSKPLTELLKHFD